jgi:dihydroorotate dehydrogenase
MTSDTLAFLKALEQRLQLLGKPSPRREIARNLRLDINAVNDWFKGARIRDENSRHLIDYARSQGVYYQEFTVGPCLWPHNAEFEPSLQFGPPPEPHKDPALIDQEIEFLGFTLCCRFGVSSGIASSTVAQIQYLFSTMIGWVTTKTLLSVQRLAHRPGNFAFRPEEPPSPLSIAEAQRPNVVFTKSSPDDSKSFRGLGTHLGLPSADASVWLPQLCLAYESVGPRGLLIPSISVIWDDGENAIVQAWDKIARQTFDEAGALAVEVNLSCPVYDLNEETEELLFKSVTAVREVAKGRKLIVKLGFLSKDRLRRLLLRIGPLVDAVAIMNALPVNALIYDLRGKLRESWPGDLTGLSGPIIKDLGLMCVKLVTQLKEEHTELRHLRLIGIGGIKCPGDIDQYFHAGADLVGAHTIFLWEPNFGYTARRHLDDTYLLARDRSFLRERLLYINFAEALAELTREYSARGKRQELRRAATEEMCEYFNTTCAAAEVAKAHQKMPVPSVSELRERIEKRFKSS